MASRRSAGALIGNSDATWLSHIRSRGPGLAARRQGGVNKAALFLAALSVLAGAGSMPIAALLHGSDDGTAALILMASAFRARSVMLVGCRLAVAGAVMQMIALNRFAEPSTTGTVKSAQLNQKHLTAGDDPDLR